MKSDWRKRKRRTRLAKANGFNNYHHYKEYVKYSVKLDGMMNRCLCDEKPSFIINFPPLELNIPIISREHFMPEYTPITQIPDFVNKFMEHLVEETWCTETYCDDDPFDCLKEDNNDNEF